MPKVTRRVGQYAADHPHGDWIEGEGWSYGYPDMPNGEFHKEVLDRVSGHRPVFLDSSMAHAAWVNSEALRRADITRSTANPAGGEIVRGADGEATGWLKEEAAIRLVQSKIPAPSPEESTASLMAAIHEANQRGSSADLGWRKNRLPALAGQVPVVASSGGIRPEALTDALAVSSSHPAV